MSYTYLQEQGEELLAESFAEIPAYVLSKLKNTPGKFCCKDNETGCCQDSQSGMTSAPLTESLGETESMLCVEDSHVRTYQQQAREQGLEVNAPDCGEKWQELSVKYCLDSCSWKTHQCLWEEVLPWSSVTLPKWGMMRSGVLWGRTTSPLPTKGTGYGSWATPTTMDILPVRSFEAMKRQAAHGGRKNRQRPGNLREQMSEEMQRAYDEVRKENDIHKEQKHLWPTPKTRDYKDTTGCSLDATNPDGSHRDRRDRLVGAIVDRYGKFPTPGINGTSNGSGNCEKINKLAESGAINEEERKSMRSGNGGQLNPDWVEWLMGWPIGWTSMKPITELDWRDWETDPADELPATNELGIIPRISTGIEDRVNRLKAIGNGQVPQVAEYAWRLLIKQQEQETETQETQEK